MSVLEVLIEAGEALHDLSKDLTEWSNETFGDINIRGPIGPLKHLEKEAKEAQDSPHDPMEYADCLLLILDAARRAHIKPLELIRYAQKKLEVCKTREYPKLTAENVDEPLEHLR